MTEPYVTFSSKALAYIAQIRTGRSQGPGCGFRLGIKPSGCSGWLYQPDVVDEVLADDVIFHIDQMQVMIPKTYQHLLQGTHVDLADKGLGQKVLVYQNPNAKGECGCGESFSTTEGGDVDD
jgi:iron-sulfur cluster assembly protein